MMQCQYLALRAFAEATIIKKMADDFGWTPFAMDDDIDRLSIRRSVARVLKENGFGDWCGWEEKKLKFDILGRPVRAYFATGLDDENQGVPVIEIETRQWKARIPVVETGAYPWQARAARYHDGSWDAFMRDTALMRVVYA